VTDGRPIDPLPPAARRRYQFGVWVWFPAALLIGVVLGAVTGMLREETPGQPLPRVFFILMAAAVPIGMLLIVSLLRALLTRDSRHAGRRGG